MKYRYTAQEKVIVWLDSFESLTYHQKIQILSLFADATQLVTNFSKYREPLLKIIPESSVEALGKALNDENYLPSLLSNLERKDIFFVTLRSSDYPLLLSQTPAPPIVLYCKGRRELLKGRHFSIVGARKTLSWAQALTKDFSACISRHFTVVTGLAEGGDASALEGALQENQEKANVVSVLAYGLDYVYPTVHAQLLDKIFKRGLVISEHRPEIKPQKYLFPVRNRIIAGLSQGVLVVSGNKKSGTSITANYALEYGKDVFAFPYNPGIASGEGCNNLLKSGAYPVDCVEDILLYYGIEKKESENGESPNPSLTAEERKIIDFLLQEGESHVENLSRACEIPVFLLGGILTGLEVKGCIVRAAGNRYTAVKHIK
ncbi:MAG: DNA-processing protein DprA [Clostridia bacterium]|nr:DNA-processing protein DprA [Clostridia bacterium]